MVLGLSDPLWFEVKARDFLHIGDAAFVDYASGSPYDLRHHMPGQETPNATIYHEIRPGDDCLFDPSNGKVLISGSSDNE